MTNNRRDSKKNKFNEECHICVNGAASFKLHSPVRVYRLCGNCKSKFEDLFDEEHLQLAIERAEKSPWKSDLLSRVATLSKQCRCDVCGERLRRFRTQPIEVCNHCLSRLPEAPIEAIELVKEAQTLSQKLSLHLPLALDLARGEITEEEAQLENVQLEVTPRVFRPPLETSRKLTTKKSQKPDQKRKKDRCQICRKGVRDKHGICKGCIRAFFPDRLAGEIPIILKEAEKISHDQKLSIGYAINVAKGTYSLEFAKRQQKLKDQEQRGYGDSLNQRAARVHGSFGSNQ